MLYLNLDKGVAMATDANKPDLLGGPDPAGPEDELRPPGQP